MYDAVVLCLLLSHHLSETNTWLTTLHLQLARRVCFPSVWTDVRVSETRRLLHVAWLLGLQFSLWRARALASVVIVWVLRKQLGTVFWGHEILQIVFSYVSGSFARMPYVRKSVRPIWSWMYAWWGSAPLAPVSFHRRTKWQFHASTCAKKMTRQEKEPQKRKTWKIRSRSEKHERNTNRKQNRKIRLNANLALLSPSRLAAVLSSLHATENRSFCMRLFAWDFSACPEERAAWAWLTDARAHRSQSQVFNHASPSFGSEHWSWLQATGRTIVRWFRS